LSSRRCRRSQQASPRRARLQRRGAGSRTFVQSNGWIRAKVGWWTAKGAPRIVGRRLDGGARPLRADVAQLSWTTAGRRFYPSILYFPSTGCWRLTAAAGGTSIDLVVRVVRT
jgi:hypothetical protein